MENEEKQPGVENPDRRELLKKLGPAAYVGPGLILLSVPLRASSPAGMPDWP
jgi:hypothetical protein